jgi:hypothetical protein
MIFDGRFAASGDDDDVLNAGMHRLFDAILNQGLVHDGQHFFGGGFGSRQKASAQASGRENCFAYLWGHQRHCTSTADDLRILPYTSICSD